MSPYIAKIVTITTFAEIPEHLLSFVEFGAALEGRKLRKNEKIAVLQVEGTQSYFPVFLEDKKSLKDLEEKLKKQDTKLNIDAKKILSRYLKRI